MSWDSAKGNWIQDYLPLLPLVIYHLIGLTLGHFDPVTCKEAALFTSVYGSIRRRRDLIIQIDKFVKKSWKIKYFYFMIYNHM